MIKRVYLDYAATTPMHQDVMQVLMTHYTDEVGQHNINKRSNWINEQKALIAHFMGCKTTELMITNSGSESNNLILKVMADFLPENKKHLLTSKIEHPSVLEVFKSLEKKGYKVTYIDVDHEGIIDFEAFKESITEQTGLVSIMYFNNETGSKQPIEAIGDYLKSKNVFFHVDGTQALYTCDFKLDQLPVDAMTVSSHKIYGPKGIGGLYLKETAEAKRIGSLICEQTSFSKYFEQGIFTENLPYLAGFAKACLLAGENLKTHRLHLNNLRDYFIEQLKNSGVQYEINGSSKQYHPGILNIKMDRIDGDAAVIVLDMKGFCVSTGSACSSGALSASHVLLAMGLTEIEAKKCLRISYGDFTKTEDLDAFVLALKTL